MKKILRLGSIVAVVAAFAVSVLGAQSAEAIVGGSNATQQYGTASIWTPPPDGSANRHRCHVNIISQYWGVTAGHCLNTGVTTPGVSEVRHSALDITVPFSPSNPQGYKSVGVAAMFRHPDFVPGTETQSADNDIALIRFTNPIQSTTPLALPSSSSPVGTIAKLAGWGWTCDTDISQPNCGLPLRFSPILKELSLKIVNPSDCTYTINAAHLFCTKAAANVNAQGCLGDSGAPLVRKGFDKFILTGIGLGDGDLVTGHPGFCGGNDQGGQGTGRFMDTAVYKQWIQDTIYNNGGANKFAHMPKFVTN